MISPNIILLVLLLGSAVPFYYFNKWSIRYMQPRRSLLRLLAWMALMLGLVFLFGFLLVWMVAQFFPRTAPL